ncbi:MAG: glycoside hydrolase family 16 protein [Bacteroidota bacterium]|nr:glycoside hydrolase family 16 protein [Bacteroidota bacterium]
MKTIVSLICPFIVMLNVNSSRVFSPRNPIADLTKKHGTPVKASSIKQADDYKLVWADEFNTDGPVNNEYWGYETGFVRNEENQWYQPENAFCKNGYLIIEAKRTHVPNPIYDSSSRNWARKRQFIDCTSSAIETAGKKSWKYGRFFMRGRINTEMGLWPAFWTLGEKGNWPSNGEIDIMEFYRHNLLANIAVGTATPNHALWYSTKKPVTDFKDKNWAKKFHVWRMDWDEDSIALFVDDILLNKVEMKQLYNRDDSGINPFKQPHFILLNLAIGGLNGGDPSATAFPSRFEVDYVRVYQKAGSL